MKLTELAEAVTEHLNNSNEVTVTATTELDPQLCMLSELGIYILPGTTQRSLQGIKPRRGVQTHGKIHFIHLVVSKEFTELPRSEGVTNWSEAKDLLDLRELCEDVIVEFGNPKITLNSIEPQEVEEFELDNRNFAAMTTFGFELCDS